ncbi:futalosine hydrolase [Halodesulfovibrio sp.]|jgi:futalosine hydrolase|uniref:futalosine hydrolase n=1 Tax=Halodesulfovibrio sp. TaxID=1912772 RepID=UPI0025F2CB22|nr:futalosine hydrolase [Halodesulfovibrio sp.]MCT4626665.1 futalosine hydrolase [Halodesulfovibrio sp.]
MTLVITTATQKEMKAVLLGFNRRGKIGCKFPSLGNYCELPVNEKLCLLAVTGVGPVNAALSIGRILGERKDVTGVLNLGVAGSFDLEQAPLCSAVVADSEIWPEYGLHTAEGIDPEGITFPILEYTGVTGTVSVWDRIALEPEKACRMLNLSVPKDLLKGASMTVSGVTGTEERARMLIERYEPLTENMEGFSLALACLQAGIPFLELRTISNLVGSRKPEHWKLDDALQALGEKARELFV